MLDFTDRSFSDFFASELQINIDDPLESEAISQVELGIQTAEWFLENIRLPKVRGGLMDQIKATVQSARQKHGLTE